MPPTLRSILHAASFLAVLALIALLGSYIDRPEILNDYKHELLLDIGIAITLAVSLNLILGIAGQFSLGHAGFVAAGAYTAILISGRWFQAPLLFLTNSLHLSTAASFQCIMFAGCLAAALVAALLGFLVGLPTLRLRGDYLAIATLGFGEILAVLIQNTEILGRATGLSLTSMRYEWISNQPDIGGGGQSPLVQSVQNYMDNTPHFVGAVAVFALAALTIFIVRNIKYATSGRALLALREDGVAAESVGIPTTRYKVAAFVIGAALAGIAGALVAHHKSLINPESFRFMRSIEIVAMVIIGGQGSITGAVLAAILLTLMPEALRSYVKPWLADGLFTLHLDAAAAFVQSLDIEKWRMVLYSLFIIFAMLFRPQGLFGRYEITDLFQWLFRKLTKRPIPKKAQGSYPWAVTSPLPAQLPTAIKNQKSKMGGGESPSPPEPRTPDPEPRALLSVSSLTMHFGGLRAVDDFNLTLLPGELVGLIGPNGAGKTTVFNALTGVYRPTAGEIQVSGKSIARLKPHAISRLPGGGVARTFQNIRLFANLSVLDNIQIAQHAHHQQGMPSAILRRPAFYREEAASRRRAQSYLALFNLAHLAADRANSLSYGDQRRLEIARALATQPRLLLLDEPAAGMNPTEKRELMDLIRSIRTQFALTILLIEHDMKVIMGVCQRILVLDYGKTIAAGTPEEIRKNPAVIEAYLGASAKQE